MTPQSNIRMSDFFAHSLPDEPPEKWQQLEDHLKNVAELAASFAQHFNGEQWAFIAGLWHDLGKYSDAFQNKLYAENGFESHIETKPGKVIHSEAGGHLATLKQWKGFDQVFSWLIMGHHTGLTDFLSEYVGSKALSAKMQNAERSEIIFKNVPKWILEREKPSQRFPLGADPSLFIRMLFSCIVDADFLDTEAFMDKKRSNLRKGRSSIADLLKSFNRFMANVTVKSQDTEINTLRSKVLNQCRLSASKEPSVFSLTVPTGGGKTLSTMAFALQHADKFKKDRIIYVIPYTSIIEQTARVFRSIPGFENDVIEHHSNLAEVEEKKETIRNRLSSENWDARIIVTTSVQFFESLYASRTSRCRKLHNIVNSVVIFDEVQCLPPAFLRPIVYVLRELYRHYKVTPVLCSATQPVLTQINEFDFSFSEGFDSVTEIIEDPESLSDKLKRVNIEIYKNNIEPVTLLELSESIKKEETSVLTIVNRKDDARELAKLLADCNTVHLSTNMCAEHRADRLKEIKLALKNSSSPIFVVSTSLVEAGVDIDFPVVYRSLAGLDSIAQAAGRCNREGMLPGLGKTVVFVPTRQPQYIRQPANLTREIISNYGSNNLLTPLKYQEYFRQRFWQLGEEALDEKNILELLSGRMNYYYRTAAERFRLIEEDWQESIVVPYKEAINLLADLLNDSWNQRHILRALGRYSVSIPKQLAAILKDKEFILESGYEGVSQLHFSLYDDIYGFVPPEESIDIDPEKLFV